MQKLVNYTFQKFLEELTDVLKAENEDREYENKSEDERYSILNFHS